MAALVQCTDQRAFFWSNTTRPHPNHQSFIFAVAIPTYCNSLALRLDFLRIANQNPYNLNLLVRRAANLHPDTVQAFLRLVI